MTDYTNSQKAAKLLNDSEILLSDRTVNQYKQRQRLLAGTYFVIGAAGWLVSSVSILWFISLHPNWREIVTISTALFFLVVGFMCFAFGTYSMGAGHSAVYLYSTVTRALLLNLETQETDNGNRNEDQEADQQADR